VQEQAVRRLDPPWLQGRQEIKARCSADLTDQALLKDPNIRVMDIATVLNAVGAAKPERLVG